MIDNYRRPKIFISSYDELREKGEEASSTIDVEEILVRKYLNQRVREELDKIPLTQAQRKAIKDLLNHPDEKKTKNFYCAHQILRQNPTLKAIWLES